RKARREVHAARSGALAEEQRPGLCTRGHSEARGVDVDTGAEERARGELMLPELGHFALILALLLAALQAFFGILGPQLGRDRWVAAVTPAVAGQFVMVATAIGCLVASFIGLDFSVLYVAENSNSALPMVYRIAAVWGAHEGSLLLWIFLLG